VCVCECVYVRVSEGEVRKKEAIASNSEGPVSGRIRTISAIFLSPTAV
jgi:hypothetical protein